MEKKGRKGRKGGGVFWGARGWGFPLRGRANKKKGGEGEGCWRGERRSVRAACLCV